MNAFAVVAGGGTAGHVLPALAVAEALVAAGHDPESIWYIGAERGIETRLLPDTPFPHRFFDVIGVQRSFSPANLRRNVGFLPKLWRARRQAITLFDELHPRVVVSVGGYASLPAVLAARTRQLPVVVISYDRFPGRASRLAAKRAAACAVAFPDSPLPRATFTGAPVRQAVLDVNRDVDRAGARRRLGLPDDRFVVAVMGGSQGSGVLNATVETLLDRAADDRLLAIRHALGERFVATARPATDGSHGVLYQPLGYEPDMATVYAAADLLIGRGGASTVHEVAATGIPSVLIPWAGSAEDHQTANVAWLADSGAAVSLAEADVDRLPAVIAELRHDVDRRAALSTAARQLGEAHRSGRMAALIESAALA